MLIYIYMYVFIYTYTYRHNLYDVYIYIHWVTALIHICDMTLLFA